MRRLSPIWWRRIWQPVLYWSLKAGENIRQNLFSWISTGKRLKRRLLIYWMTGEAALPGGSIPGLLHPWRMNWMEWPSSAWFQTATCIIYPFMPWRMERQRNTWSRSIPFTMWTPWAHWKNSDPSELRGRKSFWRWAIRISAPRGSEPWGEKWEDCLQRKTK